MRPLIFGTKFKRILSPFRVRVSERLTHTIREMISQFRQWRNDSDVNDMSNKRELNAQFNNMSVSANNHNNLQFTFMSYNILAQNLMNNHLYLYERCDNSSKSWPERGHRIIRELLQSNCDIICLQEVNFEHFRDMFLPAMKTNGYLSLYKKKTGDKLDGCAIFYNSSKFSVESTVELELKRLDMSPILDRDNIALIAKFNICNANSNVKLIVATTHLLYNPRRGDVKTAQLRLLFAEINKLALIENSGNQYNPIIFCGDLNSEPGSVIYNFIRKGFANFNGRKTGDLSGQPKGSNGGYYIENKSLVVKGLSFDSKFVDSTQNESSEQPVPDNIFRHSFNFKSVYEKTEFKMEYFSTYTGNEYGLVDYIFYSKSDNLQLIEYLPLLTCEQLQRIGRIPNSILGSDHLSLIAKFSIIY